MKNVIVAGSINMDIVVQTKKHPKIGETVFGNDLKYYPGGKGANQAVAASKLGANTIMVGMVGNDSFGLELRKFIENQGIDNRIDTSLESPTGTALITVATETSNNTIVVIPGANFGLNETSVNKVEMSQGDILICQFEIPIDTIKYFFTKGRKAGTINILNPAPAKAIPNELLSLVDILILNETELEFISNSKVDSLNETTIINAIKAIEIKDKSIIVTLGENGVIAFIKDQIISVPARKVETIDTTGAGDCFVGAIAAKLATGLTVEKALQFANIAASICVTREGAGVSIPSIDEVNEIVNLKS